jgi:import inner membrane translocase subunit TIM22
MGSVYDTYGYSGKPMSERPSPFHPATADPLRSPSSAQTDAAVPGIRHSVGGIIPLAFPAYWRPAPPVDGAPPDDYAWVSSHCGGRSAIGVIGGGVMGLGMGVFLGAMADMTPPVTVFRGKEVPLAPFKEQAKAALRQTGEKSLYWSRNFAFITGVFSGSECVVEKLRGRTDVWNATISGCVTGAALQAKAGPSSAAFGCIGFATFSLLIDQVMGTHS